MAICHQAARWIVGIALVVSPWIAPAAASAQSCEPHLAQGMPTGTSDRPSTFICRKGYALLHDDARKVPYWVAYELTRDHALGCLDRKDTFSPDPALPEGRRAELIDYKRSGYDRGHSAPAADMEWDRKVANESFFLSNMTPQLHALNGAWWSQLEEAVRSWSASRERLLVITGPIFNPDHAKSIGPGNVGVPSGYYKLIYDPAKAESLSFIVPHAKIQSGNFDHWVREMEEIEAMINFNLLPLVDRSKIKQSKEAWPITINFKSLRKTTCNKAR